jgi:hypothetical protein
VVYGHFLLKEFQSWGLGKIGGSSNLFYNLFLIRLNFIESDKYKEDLKAEGYNQASKSNTYTI